jgi:prepilin-type N-terminal cleavage/methylation domain-containing protein
MNRRGFTLIEILIVVVLIGVIVAVAGPRLRTALVRQNVRSARDALVTMHATARASAIQRGRYTALWIVGDTALVVAQNPVTAAFDTIVNPVNLRTRWGVAVTTNNNVLTFDPRGLFTTGGTTKIVVQRGVFQDAIEINPVGRVLR